MNGIGLKWGIFNQKTCPKTTFWKDISCFSILNQKQQQGGGDANLAKLFFFGGGGGGHFMQITIHETTQNEVRKFEVFLFQKIVPSESGE